MAGSISNSNPSRLGGGLPGGQPKGGLLAGTGMAYWTRVYRKRRKAFVVLVKVIGKLVELPSDIGGGEIQIL